MDEYGIARRRAYLAEDLSTYGEELSDIVNDDDDQGLMTAGEVAMMKDLVRDVKILAALLAVPQ
jgi:hypothetical protein